MQLNDLTNNPLMKVKKKHKSNKKPSKGKGSTIFLSFNGKRQNLSAWSKDVGICVATLNARRLKGLPIEDILEPKNMTCRKPSIKHTWR